MTDHETEPDHDIKGASVLTLVNMSDSTFKRQPELLPCVFYGFTMSLVRSSASRIYLVAVGQEESDKLIELVNGLPSLLATRVKVVDRDQKVYDALRSIMSPIYAEADYLWDKEYPDQNDAPSPGHEHTVCMLYELMHLLILGQMYGAEVDFDPALARHCLARLRNRLTSREACGALARLEGIAHAYSDTSEVSSLVPLTESAELRTGSLLRDLLEDARWVDASQARHQIGILGNLRRACNMLKRKLTEILRDPTKQKYLSMGRQFITTAAEKAPIPLPVPPSGDSGVQAFSPPLHPLNGLKPHCIGTTRWFPFVPSEVGTGRYLEPEPKRCPVGFLFEHKGHNQVHPSDKKSSNKPDAGDGK